MKTCRYISIGFLALGLSLSALIVPAVAAQPGCASYVGVEDGRGVFVYNLEGVDIYGYTLTADEDTEGVFTYWLDDHSEAQAVSLVAGVSVVVNVHTLLFSFQAVVPYVVTSCAPEPTPTTTSTPEPTLTTTSTPEPTLTTTSTPEPTLTTTSTPEPTGVPPTASPFTVTATSSPTSEVAVTETPIMPTATTTTTIEVLLTDIRSLQDTQFKWSLFAGIIIVALAVLAFVRLH